MTTKSHQALTWSFLLVAGMLALTTGCKPKAEADSEAAVAARTPVTVTSIQHEPMTDYLDLNAHTTFLKKSSVKATVTGHIESLGLNPGDVVQKGQVLLTMRTKESAAMEGFTPSDSAMRFKGVIKIKAPQSGVISAVVHQNGDNVMEGDELVVIAEQSSLVFLLEVPYELNQVVTRSKACKIELSDNRELEGVISSRLPVMDAQSQTESYIVTVKGKVALPENLIARVRIVKSAKSNAAVLPKDAVLANETQSEFWVMKLINDTVAVKVPIQKGIESGGKVEIATPAFQKNDRILLTGNYGLADTATVKIKTLK